MKKVRGEVNPADVFTKHLSSEDRIADLCRLFRCRFATGRAAGAPSLKRTGLDEKLLAVDMVQAAAGPLLEQDGFLYPVGDYEGTAVPEAYLHDASQLPHLIALSEGGASCRAGGVCRGSRLAGAASYSIKTSCTGSWRMQDDAWSGSAA